MRHGTHLDHEEFAPRDTASAVALERPSGRLDVLPAERRGEMLARVLRHAAGLPPVEAGPLLAKYMVPVLPLNPDKSPASHLGPRRGSLDATTFPHEAEEWWNLGDKSGKRIGVGIATGPCKAYRHGIVVVDLDRHGVDDGLRTWNEFPAVRRLGWTVDEAMERTLVSQTPRGGAHLWFTVDPGLTVISNSAGELGPGIDVRGRSGYVAAAPTDGYRFVGDSRIVAPAPDWLIGILAMPAWERKFRPKPHQARSGGDRRRAYEDGAVPGVMEEIRSAPEGQRHKTLLKCSIALVRIHRRTGGDIDSLLSDLSSVALGTGLDDKEVAKTISDGRRWAETNLLAGALEGATVDIAEEMAIIDGWRAWWRHQDHWIGSPGITTRAVAETLLDVAAARSHRHFTLTKSDLGLLSATSSSTAGRVVTELVGFMFDYSPGDGIKASEFTLLSPPRVGDIPTCSWRASRICSSRDPRDANPGACGRHLDTVATMPIRHHDAFTSAGVGLIGRAVLEQLAHQEIPTSVKAMAHHLGVSWSAVNNVVRDLDQIDAATKSAGPAWTLVATPDDAADRLARLHDAEGTTAERLGRSRRRFAARKHDQAIYASRQKETSGSVA